MQSLDQRGARAQAGHRVAFYLVAKALFGEHCRIALSRQPGMAATNEMKHDAERQRRQRRHPINRICLNDVDDPFVSAVQDQALECKRQ